MRIEKKKTKKKTPRGRACEGTVVIVFLFFFNQNLMLQDKKGVEMIFRVEERRGLKKTVVKGILEVKDWVTGQYYESTVVCIVLHCICKYAICVNKFIPSLVSQLVGLFYGISTFFGSFNAESSHFDESLFISRSSYLQIFIHCVQ